MEEGERMILIDVGGLIHANIHGFTKDLEKGTIKENEDLIRHIIINSVLNVRKKYGKSAYGNVVLACDARTYWRNEIFPHYKGNRKVAREESKIDWDAAFNVINQVLLDIERVFPYKVINVPRAEADDVIAVLTEYTQENELVTTGLYEESQPVLVVAEDLDFTQLFKYDNFKQFYPRKKKMAVRLTTHALLEFTREHVAKAGDDGIPGILCPDDHFVKEVKVRAPNMSAKRLEEFKSIGRAACKDDLEKSRWDRNEKLIDFVHIPAEVSLAIIEAYKNANGKTDRNAIFEYLVEKRCRVLLNSIEDF